ncbi:hypothetical protein AB0J82_21140 [Asanoa sp. NPDC049518]|uniref:hypothetical protein n=1 Tax=unclassified Asanoa TaxID=2685164 RepID=UPI00343EDA36
MTLLAEQWACALFLDEGNDLWFVNRIGRASWEWESAGLVGPRHEVYRAANQISQLLRMAAHTLITAVE